MLGSYTQVFTATLALLFELNSLKNSATCFPMESTFCSTQQFLLDKIYAKV